MDEIELFAIGAVLAVALAVAETYVHDEARRSLLDLAVVAVLAGALYLLRLNVVQDASDFLSADAGVVLVVGACGIGGILPPALLPR